jgi:hypothetical protein
MMHDIPLDWKQVDRGEWNSPPLTTEKQNAPSGAVPVRADASAVTRSPPIHHQARLEGQAQVLDR